MGNSSKISYLLVYEENRYSLKCDLENKEELENKGKL